MSSPSGSTYDKRDAKEADVRSLLENNLTPPAVVTETSLFRRANVKACENDEDLEELYAPIVNYEGAHRYDPKFQWDTKDEKKVVRKVGLAIQETHTHS